jgi:hypothetical protein
MRPQERDGPPKKRYLDFLDILLTARDDTGAGMTPLEIRSEVDTFMFEGKSRYNYSHKCWNAGQIWSLEIYASTAPGPEHTTMKPNLLTKQTRLVTLSSWSG